MKKRILIAVAMIALPLLSCTKEAHVAPEQEPEAAPVEAPADGQTVVFAASTDSPTRTYMSQDGEVYRVLWSAGDVINVNGTNLTLQSENQPDGYGPGCAKGLFQGYNPSVNGTGPKYKAIYPASLRDKYGYYNLPTEQTYVAGGIAEFPMYAEADEASLSFRNLCGIICISLKGEKSVSSISLADKSAEPVALSGRFTVSGNAAVTATGANGTAVVCSTPVALNTSDFTPFNIAVPAGSYSTLQIVIEASDGTICKKTSNKPVVVERSKITPINLSSLEFKNESAKIYYTTKESNKKLGTYAASSDASVFGTGLHVVSHDYDSDAKSGVITVSGPITQIGNSAFNGKTNNGYILTFTIPNTVTSIGDNAFNGCSSLKSVNFPAGLTSVGYNAFVNCHAFVPGDISHLTSIGESAFQYTNISGTVTIPEGLTLLGKRAFYDCDGITEVLWGHTPATMGVEIFASCDKVESVTFADGGDIPGYLFNVCRKLKTINFNAEITSIGDYAFNGCSALESLVIPATVGAVGQYAFSGCESLATVDFGNITSLGRSAFEGCSALTKVVLPNTLTKMYSMDTFKNCTSLTRVVLPESAGFTTIVQRAFSGCTNLTDTSIPSNITSIEAYAFADCGFTALPDGWGRSGLSYGNRPYEGCRIQSITFPDTWTSVPENFCAKWKQLQEVHLGSGITHLYGGAFDGCSALTDGSKIQIPAQVSVIRSRCFQNTGLTSLPSGINRSDIALDTYIFNGSALTSVDVSAWTDIPGSTFQNCTHLSSVTLGNSLISIGANAFEGCSALTSITLPASLMGINNYGFAESGLTALPSGFKAYSSMGTNVFKGTPIVSAVLPDGMTALPGSTFANCSLLQSIDLNDVETVGSSALSGCTALSSVTANHVKSLGDNAFDSNASLASINLPVVETLGNYVFTGCTALRTVDLGSSVKTLKLQIFNSCNALEGVYIRNGAAVASLDRMLKNAAPYPPIYVPAGLVGAYKTTDPWSLYKDNIYGIDGIPVTADPVSCFQLGDGSTPYYTAGHILDAFNQNGGTLTYQGNYGSELTFAPAVDGIVDFNGYNQTVKIWLQNVAGTLTLRNGTITKTDDCIDGAYGFADGFSGTVIMENMNVNGILWTDSHPFIIRSGDYNVIRNMKMNMINTAGSGTVTIEGGRFKKFYDYTSSGWTIGTYIISGGKFAFNPTASASNYSAANTTIATGYSVKDNTDSDSGTYPYIVTAD
ncbi:MAG: leucine-rich repeat protein [Bacteroidales bacterium]|nr:leucine-rich repeat protein [Bacteroidales bacterium]